MAIRLTTFTNVNSYGARLPTLLYSDLRDRLTGNAARANARWGWLTAPQSSGKLIWIVAGSSAESVRLGVEVTRAIREKRLDVRLVLTFEREHQFLLAPLYSLKKTGWGYGPSDYSSSVSRALRKLQPFAIIFVGAPPKPNLARALQTIPHKMVIAAENKYHVDATFDFIYPATELQAQGWNTLHLSPVVDFFSLLSEAQIDPNLKSIVNGEISRRLWWLHADDASFINEFIKSFNIEFPRDVLFVSGSGALPASVRMSTWQRTPFPEGTIVWVDDLKWIPAVAACATASHFFCITASIFWQAMAGGSAISVKDARLLPKKTLAEAIAVLDGKTLVLEKWQAYCDNPILTRKMADTARRFFWEERRLSVITNRTLLQNVFDWN